MRDKLIRNLRTGDIVQVTDATHCPSRIHRVTVTSVQEIRRNGFDGSRQWEATFTPALCFGTWHSVTGGVRDRVPVI